MSYLISANCRQSNKLTRRYLEMVGASFGGKYVVTVHQTKEGLWTITVKFEGKNEEHSIGTSRGDMKVWRNIFSAITFVQENCKFASEVL
jgi:hypothetical protein